MPVLSTLTLPTLARDAVSRALADPPRAPSIEAWTPCPTLHGAEWRDAAGYWLFRLTYSGQGRPPSRIVGILPEAEASGVCPPRDPLPTSLPRSCPPIGWRYVKLMLAAKEVSAMAMLGHPTYLWHARAARNGSSFRPGRRRVYTIPVAENRQPGGLVRVTYTPSLGQAVPIRRVSYPMKGTLPTDWAPGTWQDTLLRHLRALSTWQNP